METKHTPGRWIIHLPRAPKLHAHSHRDPRLMVLHPDGERLICQVGVGRTSSAGTIPDAELIANAHLIAAAPKMLSALLGARDALRKALPLLPADDEAIHAGEWIDELNETIAEATR